MTTIGATARIGTVCDETTYGSRPRWRRRHSESATPSRKPNVAPSAKPTSASLAVNQVACRSWTSRMSPVPEVGLRNSAARMSWMCGIVVESTTNGHVQPSRIQSQRYPSQKPQRTAKTSTSMPIRAAALLIGGHIDSVPNGGWLDGALNVLAGVEVLRRIVEEGTPPVTVRLVNWADEEGARFGRSLFGSSAAAGSMADHDELRQRHDAEGVALPDAIARFAVDLDAALRARSELEHAAAYLELHIEQGPVLESL